MKKLIFILPVLLLAFAVKSPAPQNFQPRVAFTNSLAGGGGGGGGSVATDNFDSYAQFDPLDSEPNWVNVSGDQIYIVKPASDGAAYPAITELGERAIRHTATLTANQYTSGTLQISGSGQTVGIGPAVRCQPGADSWYAVVWYANLNTLYLEKCNGGTTTTITSVTKTYSDGAKLKLEVTGTGSASRLTAYEDTGSGWVAVFSAVDPGGTYIDGGYGGIVGWGTSSNASLDDWEGGNL